MGGIKLSLDEALRQARADRGPHDAEKWPARKTLFFVAGASLGLWLVIVLSAMTLLN